MMIGIVITILLILYVMVCCIAAVWLNLFDREDKKDEGE